MKNLTNQGKAVYYYIFILLFPVMSFAQDITTRNGVRYIKNDKLQQQTMRNFDLQFVRKYGGLELESDDIILYDPRSVVVDENGNLIILDFVPPYIKVYDSKGQFVMRFGNKGQGPGELTTPVGLALNSEGYLYIAEFNNNITILSRNGNYINRIYPSERENLVGFRINRSGNLIFAVTPWLVYIPPGEKYINSVMRLFDPSGALIKGFGKIHTYDDQTISRVANNVSFFIDEQDYIYVTYRYQNRIEKYSPGGDLLLSISRKLAFSVTQNPKAILKKRKNGVIYGVDAPTMNIVSCGIGTDEKGRIWVMTFSRQPMYEKNNIVADGETDYTKLEIYDADGLLIDEIPLQDDFAPSLNSTIYIKGRRLFLINKNDASISEYEIVN